MIRQLRMSNGSPRRYQPNLEGVGGGGMVGGGSGLTKWTVVVEVALELPGPFSCWRV